MESRLTPVNASIWISVKVSVVYRFNKHSDFVYSSDFSELNPSNRPTVSGSLF